MAKFTKQIPAQKLAKAGISIVVLGIGIVLVTDTFVSAIVPRK